jgi:hypothetical protein
MKPFIKQLLREALEQDEPFKYSIVKETEKAVLIKFKVYKNKEGIEEFLETWVPKSIINNSNEFNEFIVKAVAEKNQKLENWMKSKGYGHLRGGAGYSLNKPKPKEKIKTQSVSVSPESFPHNGDVFFNNLELIAVTIKVLDENYKQVESINNTTELYKYSLEYPEKKLFYMNTNRGGKDFYIKDTNYESIVEKILDNGGNPDDVINQNQIIQLNEIKFKKTSSYNYK